MKTRIALAVVLLCCSAVGQQTTITKKFFGADFNKLKNVPGIDGTGKAAFLGGLRLWDSGVKWSQIEASRNSYDWSKLDD